jgi:hypothetical protein
VVFDGDGFILQVHGVFTHIRSGAMKASRPLIRVLVINDNHYGLTILFEL